MNNQFAETIELLNKSNFYYIITTSMEGTYSYVNKHYSDTFVHIHGDIVGKPYQMTMHPDDSAVCVEVAEKCFNNPDKLFPATIRKHDGMGGYFITQWEYKAMFKDDGTPEGIFCLGYDITKSVEERSQLNLLQDNYERFQTLIEKKDEILKQIVFHQSHIIRHPVTNILGLAHILQRMEVDKNLQNIIDMLLQSTEQLDEVIKGIVNKAYE
jgi:PAS domain S-box-containing protein